MNMRKEIISFIKKSTFSCSVIFMLSLCGCSGEDKGPADAPSPDITVKSDRTDRAADEPDKEETLPDYTDGLGDTFSGEISSPSESGDKKTGEDESEGEEDEEDVKTAPSKDVDLIFFMGQSNMSGAGGDASLAPYVSEEAGMEFRAVSDPTTLYPIVEPFGVNENDPTGLHEYPEAKKGSLVSAFVNEYHKLTGRRVIAVSASMGATDMNTWITDGVRQDVKRRLDRSISYLKDNGYNIGHMYALWLHGESDAIGHTDPAVYKTCLDDVMRPLFIAGVRKVFLIAPGRTIDYKDIFADIINVEKEICAESDYYAMATTILTRVSTEYMLDQYHYNQHVLNMTGIDAAASVAYYTEHSVEKIVYDYREGKYIIPDGVEADSQKKDHIDIYDININEAY